MQWKSLGDLSVIQLICFVNHWLGSPPATIDMQHHNEYILRCAHVKNTGLNRNCYKSLFAILKSRTWMRGSLVYKWT